MVATVDRVDLKIKTAVGALAGTDGFAYFGLCGREFRISSTDDDFEAGSDRIYTYGAGANVEFSNFNDPRSPFAIRTEDVSIFPAYVRFVPSARGEILGLGDTWEIESIRLTLNPGSEEIVLTALGGSNRILLGHVGGLICYLRVGT